MTPEITMLYAGILALFIIPMAGFVISRRIKHNIAIGSGRADGLEGERDLLKAVRIHGNFIEYVPFILFLFLLLELSGACALQLHILGTSLIIARLLHALGLYKTPEGASLPRLIGTVLTFLILLTAAILNITHFLGYKIGCFLL